MKAIPRALPQQLGVGAQRDRHDRRSRHIESCVNMAHITGQHSTHRIRRRREIRDKGRRANVGVNIHADRVVLGRSFTIDWRICPGHHCPPQHRCSRIIGVPLKRTNNLNNLIGGEGVIR